ncbi:hypothetical protein [Rhizobium laguerreae]|uniref:hypothetical protein n=1 Tax=Rhizobium laguerreae TaxID=1076926 RepID=UPI001C90DDEE|nr:hypothetical protein [Rhizobium laguerreae]MBY3314701.1 hypothetical protein [Rhizobium laguerreae]
MEKIEVLAHHALTGDRYSKGVYLTSQRGILRSLHLALLQCQALSCEWSIEVDGVTLPERWQLDQGDAWQKAQDVASRLAA